MTPKLLVAWAMTFVLSACCFRCAPEQKSYVDVPATLDAVKKRAKPHEVVVTVERKTRSSGGGGGCGHSAACVIILPFLLYSAVFPEKFDEVTVTENGVETFSGLYSTSGDLLSARAKTETGWRELVQLDLPELGQRAIIEAAKVTTSDDGGETRTPTTIQSQVDLVAQYRQALSKSEGEKRGKLLVEAATMLGSESEAFVLERVAAEDEPDVSRSMLVDRLCNNTLSPEETKKVEALIAAAMTHPALLTSKSVLACEPAPEATIIAAAAFVTERLCAAKTGREAQNLETRATQNHLDARTTGVNRGLAKCTPGGAVVAKLMMHEPVTTEAWLESLKQPEADVIADVTDSYEQEKIITAIKKGVRVDEMLKKAKAGRLRLTLPEATLLLDLAFKQPPNWETRAAVAGSLRNSIDLRPQLEPRLEKVAKADERTANVMLAMLGDQTVRDALADALPLPALQRLSLSTIDDEDELVIEALVALGCRESGLKSGVKAAACH